MTWMQMIAHLIYYLLGMAGIGLTIWAKFSLPRGTIDFPTPIRQRTERGPYRWVGHPMYIGTIMMLTGMGGLGGGFWNALAFLILSELMMREWAWREDQ